MGRRKFFTNEQAADMLRTDVREVQSLADELGIDDDKWDLDVISEANELLEDDDDEPEAPRRPRSAASLKAVERARHLIKLALSNTEESEQREAAMQAVRIIHKHGLLDDAGNDGEEDGPIAEAAQTFVDTMMDGFKRAATSRVRQGIRGKRR
jgi:hypothetical protein